MKIFDRGDLAKLVLATRTRRNIGITRKLMFLGHNSLTYP